MLGDPFDMVVDAAVAGTNSGDVTLAGALDYLTISGQTITRGPIDLATDTTGSLAWASVSKSGSSLADLATRSAADLTSGTLDAARLPTPGTTTLGGVKRNAGSGGQFVNGIDTDGSLLYGTPAGGGAGMKYARLTGDVAVTDNANFQNITGLSFAVDANTAYDFRLEIILTTSAAGTGSHFGWTFPSSPTQSTAKARIFNNNATGAFTAGMTSASGEIASNGTGSTSERIVEIWGTFVNGANAGTVQFTMKVETAVSGTVTAKPGSVVKWQEITVP
jgi:hypothetical protein